MVCLCLKREVFGCACLTDCLLDESDEDCVVVDLLGEGERKAMFVFVNTWGGVMRV